MKTIKGFTLIELIVVIVILGILGAVAIPQFIDLEMEASQAAVDGMAGALNSASALNYAACRAKSKECQSKIANCNGFGANPVITGGLDSDYAITSLALAAGTGSTTPCVVSHKSSGLSANFTGITP